MNIVFDLGGVVFNWQPDDLVKSVFEDSETQRSAKVGIIGHPDWIELDRGTMTRDRAIDRGAARTGIPRQDVTRLFDALPPSLTPIEETIRLVSSLRDTNNKLFVLSNLHLATIAYLEREHTIWRMFEGVVISSRVRMVKPEIEIFEHLLASHQLSVAETIFIDDMDENVAAASSIGIQTIRFVDPAQCRQALVDLECM